MLIATALPAVAGCRADLDICRGALDACTVPSEIDTLTSEIEGLRAEVDTLNQYMFGGDGTLPAKANSVARNSVEGHQALAETKELRGRVYPLFSIGPEHNAGIIQCYQRECADIYAEFNNLSVD